VQSNHRGLFSVAGAVINVASVGGLLGHHPDLDGGASII
jgi:hypothetical protein